MPDMDVIVKSLRGCSDMTICPDDCSYKRYAPDCIERLHKDAIAMLKEQNELLKHQAELLEEQEEPKQVVRKQCKTERPDGAIDCYAEWYCPHCDSLLKRGYDAAWIKYCFKCGKPVAWGGR